MSTPSIQPILVGRSLTMNAIVGAFFTGGALFFAEAIANRLPRSASVDGMAWIWLLGWGIVTSWILRVAFDRRVQLSLAGKSIGVPTIGVLLLALPAQAQSTDPSDHARLASCIDRQRPAAERARLCRTLIGTPGTPIVLRRQAREAEARALLEASNWEGMLKAAGELLAEDPGDRLGHAMRGHAYLHRGQPGDPERARDAYSEGMKHAPNAYLFPHQRGLARSQLGDAEGALADHSLALSLQSDYVPALLARSRLLNARGDHAGALRDAEAGLRGGANNVPLLDEQSRALVGLGREREAIAILDRAIQLAPQRPLLHFRRGFIRGEAGDAEGAIADFTREIAVNPELPGAYVQRGRHLLDTRKDGAGARADFDRAIAVQPGFAMAWANRSRARLLAGDTANAEKDARHALTLDPGDPVAKHTLAGLAEIRGSSSEAVALLEDVLTTLPGVTEVRLQQIGILMRLGRDEDALRSARTGLALVPGNLDLLDVEAAALLRLRRISEGKQILDRAIAEGRRRASTHANRAAFALYLRDFNLAGSDAAAALQLDPKHAQANALAGLLALRVRDGAKAERAAAMTLASDPGNSVAMAIRAELLRRQGKSVEAEQALQAVRRKAPHVLELLRMIEAP